MAMFTGLGIAKAVPQLFLRALKRHDLLITYTMITCPNCNHQNPDGANQCEACYTPLTSDTSSNMISCPQCGAPVQADARFCGQCGYSLNPEAANPGSPSPPEPLPETIFSQVGGSSEIPSPSSYNLSAPSPIESSEYDITTSYEQGESASSESELMETTLSALPTSLDEPEESVSATSPTSSLPTAMEEEEEEFSVEESTLPVSNPPTNPLETESEAESVTVPMNPPPPTPIPAAVPFAATQLQLKTAYLLHVQTNTKTELPQGLAVVHLGKPNDQVPPDIDLTGFPNSEIVSRRHADIRVEGGIYYIEDLGSSNGTYINHTSLLPGNRHRLRPGDRIALGKEDKVTFIFQFT